MDGQDGVQARLELAGASRRPFRTAVDVVVTPARHDSDETIACARGRLEEQAREETLLAHQQEVQGL